MNQRVLRLAYVLSISLSAFAGQAFAQADDPALSRRDLTFTYRLGGTLPPAQFISSPTGGAGVPFTAAASDAWLAVEPPAGAAGTNIRVSARPAGLSEGIYYGSIVLRGDTTREIAVTLYVVAEPADTLPPLVFTSQNGSVPPPRVALLQGGVSVPPVDRIATAVSGSQWLQARPASNATGAVTLSVDPFGLGDGVYTGFATAYTSGLPCRASGAGPRPHTATAGTPSHPLLSAAADLNGDGLPDLIVVDPESPSVAILLAGRDGGYTPAAQAPLPASPLSYAIATGDFDGDGRTDVAIAGDTVTVLLADGAGGFAPAAYSPLALAGLPETATSEISPSRVCGGRGAGALGVPQLIPVKLQVGKPKVLTGWTITPGSLSFTYVKGGAVPSNQTIAVSSGAAGSLPFSATASTTDNASWLSVSPGAGPTPASLTVSVNPAAISTGPGTYTGTVTVTSDAGSETINVTLKVQTTISLSATSLSFTMPQGGSAPAPQTVNVTTADGSPIQITAAPANAVPFTVTPVSSNTASTGSILTVTPNSTLAPGTYSTVILVSSPLASNSPLRINATLTVTGALSLSSGNLAFSYTMGGPLPAAQTVSASVSGGPNLPLSVTLDPTAPWLIAAALPQGTTTPANLSISVDPSSSPGVGYYYGTITVTGTGASNGPQCIYVSLQVDAPVVSSPASLTFTAPVGSSAPLAQSLSLTSIGGSVAFQASYSSDLNWLSIPQTISETPATLSVTADPTGLAAATYTGSVTITPGSVGTAPAYAIGGTQAQARLAGRQSRPAPRSASPTTVPVTLKVTAPLSVAPSALSFTCAQGGPAPAAQSIAVSAGGPAIPFTATLPNAVSWLSVANGTGTRSPAPVTGTTGSAPVSLTVSVNPGTLAPGTYRSSISVTSPLASAPVPPVAVTLTVAAPITATPTSLAFTSVAGGTSPAAQGLLLDSSVPSPFTATVSTASGGNWLSVSPASGTTRQTVMVTADPASLHLPAGVYTGSVSITPPGATSASPVTVPVTLTVTAPLSLSPSALSFTASPGGQSPTPQTVAVSAGGSAIPFTARSSAAWLSVTSGGTTPASVSVSVNPSAAVPGLQTGVITIHSDLESNGDQSVTVTLNVVVPTVAPSSLAFVYSTGGTPPPTQLLAVNNLLPTSFWVFANSAWLNATQTSPTTPSMVQVSVFPAGLAPGTYSGSVTVFYVGGSIQVLVTLTVAAALSVSPASLAFTYAAGGARPPAQSVSVTSGGASMSFNVTAVTASGGNWLTADTAFGATPRALNISADPTGLRPGVYAGSVTLTPTDSAAPGTKTISVTLTVTAALSPSPAALSFTALAGGPSPNPQQISVTSGGTPVSITASASGGAWLSVAPTSATTPASLSVTVNPAGLAAGAYPGTITVSGVGVASKTVNVSLTVVPADLVLSSSSLTYSGNSGATNPILQSISVTSNSALPLNFTVSGNLDGVPADALSVTPSSGTTPTLVTVGVNPARMAAGTYSGTLQFQTAQKTYRAGISVTLVDAPPSLSVTPALLMFAPLRPSDGAATRALMIQNTGGGSALPFTVTASGGPWLSISPSSGTLSGQTASPVQVSVDPANLAPGSYQATLHVQMGSLSQDVPLSFLVLGGQPFIGLSFKGVEFEARVGEGLTFTRDVSVFNQGGGSLNWTASIAGGSDWLSLQQGAGAFTLTTHSTSLSAGPHYATVQVSDPNAANSPQLVTVVLNMVPAGASAVPIPSPAGLLFIAAAGGPAPAAQTVSVFTSSSSPTGFQAAAQTADGGGWLSVTPSSGTTSTNNTGSVTVMVAPTSLQPGVYQGGVSFSVAAGVVRTTTVTLIVVPPGTPVPLSRPSTAPKAVTNCTPSKLVPIYTDLVNNFSSPAGWPVPVSVRLVDSCGNNMPGGSVVLSFSKGSPQFASMALADSSLALFTATWVPATSANQINVTAKAVAGNLQGTAQVNATVSGNTSPILNPNGTQRNVMPVAGAPLAPGTVIQIFGDNFADNAVQATTLPLPIDMNGTQVLIGGRAAPLYYVSKNQINALIPTDLPPRDSYPVLVSVNGSITVPDTIDVVPANPGVVALPSGQVLAQHADYRLIGPDSPAAPGETVIVYLVGMGDTDPSVPSGAAAPSAEPLARVKSVPVVTLDGKPVNLLYAGLSPGGVGLYQINFTVPSDAASGNLNLAITQAGRDANSTQLPVGN